MSLQQLREITEKLNEETPVIEEFFHSPRIGTAVLEGEKLVVSNSLGQKALEEEEIKRIIKTGIKEDVIIKETHLEGDCYLVIFFNMGNYIGVIITRLMSQAIAV
jgi:hypothetical protein